MQVCEFTFTARFARGTEDAENISFSIAVERTAMEKHLAVYTARKQRMIDAFNTNDNSDVIFHEGLCILLFGVSAKSKKEKSKTLRSLRLCGE